jgi:DNA-directed RNA polymerase subunit M/transcription elongation factor TFIIS
MDDPGAGEFLRMAERYRRMSDEELLVLMPQSSELTPFAQQALANEIRSRGLKAEVQDEETSAPSPSESKSPQFTPPAFFARKSDHESERESDRASPEHGDWATEDSLAPESSYDEDRRLVELCTVWSERDALQLQTILDGAGIPFFTGKEKATGVDKVTSNFSSGVSVQVMQIGVPWARSAMQRYAPEDDPTPKVDEELDEVAVHCPKCHSTEVVFEGRTSELADAKDGSSQKFEWSCDSCGHHWVDDGIEKEG